MSDTATQPITLRVPANFAGERLDRALAKFLPSGSGATGAPSPSRSALQRWVREGRVTIDGVCIQDPAHTLRANTLVVVTPAEPPPSDAVPEDLPLEVLHEDDDVIVVNKAAGMVVHPAAGHARGTLVNALLHRFGPLPTGVNEDSEEGDEEVEPARYARPGIVHRLDRWTSGVMVIARSERARTTLMTQFAAHSIERAYLAIAEGIVKPAQTFDTLHGRHPTDRKRFTGKVREGKRAVTHVKRLEVFEGACLVECRLETGRTHQIRVHLSEAGHPLLADEVYGRTPSREPLRAIALALGRQALHAAVLGFVHPSGKTLRFETNLPEDMRATLAALRRK